MKFKNYTTKSLYKGSYLWSLWSMDLPWEEVPEHSRLLVPPARGSLYRVWALCMGPWRQDLPVLVLRQSFMRGWSVWAPGIVPSPGSWILQMWEHFLSNSWEIVTLYLMKLNEFCVLRRSIVQQAWSVFVSALQDLLLRRSRAAKRIQVRERSGNSLPQMQFWYFGNQRPQHVK